MRTLSAVLVACLSVSACQRSAPPAPPMLLLVSIDGMRWDAVSRTGTPFFEALASRGVRAGRLVPVFPSLTFPNHYSLVTGLRPGRHGIVSNNIVDPDLPARFTLSDRKAQEDARWWGGEPIWLTGSKLGRKSSPYFWPGAENAIQGQRPAYWLPFDDAVPAPARVDRLLQWLDLPEPERPAFLTLYFSDVDHANHEFGPDSPESRAASALVDRELERLSAAVQARGLASHVNWVVTSDHGSAPLSRDRVIVLDDFLDPSTVDVVDWGPWFTVFPLKQSAEEIYAALAGRHPAFSVYRRDEIPERYGLRGHPRVPPVVGLADEGWSITTRARLDARDPGRPWGGAHGFDPGRPSMHGVFVAAGPRVHERVHIDRLENVDVYNVMCRILEWTPAPNDGNPEAVNAIVK